MHDAADQYHINMTINNLTVTRNTYTCATSEVSRHSGIRHTPVTHAICGTLCLWLFHPA